MIDLFIRTVIFRGTSNQHSLRVTNRGRAFALVIARTRDLPRFCRKFGSGFGIPSTSLTNNNIPYNFKHFWLFVFVLLVRSDLGVLLTRISCTARTRAVHDNRGIHALVVGEVFLKRTRGAACCHQALASSEKDTNRINRSSKRCHQASWCLYFLPFITSNIIYLRWPKMPWIVSAIQYPQSKSTIDHATASR